MVNIYRGLALGLGWRFCMYVLFSFYEDFKLGNSSQQVVRVFYCFLFVFILSLLRDWFLVLRFVGGFVRIKWFLVQIGFFLLFRVLIIDQVFYELKVKE